MRLDPGEELTFVEPVQKTGQWINGGFFVIHSKKRIKVTILDPDNEQIFYKEATEALFSFYPAKKGEYTFKVEYRSMFSRISV